MIDPRIRSSAAVLAAAAALLLSGCGSLAGPAASPEPTQSQAQQCGQVMADVQGIAADVGRAAETVGTDPIGALALVGSISDRVGGLQTRISDPELLDRIEEIQAGWDAIVEDAQVSIAGGGAAGIDRVVTGLTELGEQVSALQEFCAGAA